MQSNKCLSLACKNSNYNYKLNLIQQGFKLLPSMSNVIHSDNGLYFIRNVLIHINNQPSIYGVTILPSKTYDKYESTLNTLGNNPIGEKLLFITPNTVKHPHYYKTIGRHDVEFDCFLQKICPKQETLYGRQTMYNLNSFPLLLTEIFLPMIPIYPTNAYS